MAIVSFNNEGRLENNTAGNTVVAAAAGGSTTQHLIKNDTDHTVSIEFDTSAALAITFPASELETTPLSATAGATTFRALAPGESILISVTVTGDDEANFRMAMPGTRARHLTSAVRLARKTRATSNVFGRLISALV